MLGDNGRWQVFEIGVDGVGPAATDRRAARRRQLRRLLPARRQDRLHLDRLLRRRALRLRQLRTWPMLYVMDADGENIRQLCFDQEHNWCPTVLNNGRVLYSRWEYTDTPHSQHAAPVPHEPRRHGADGVLRQQLLLAQLDLLRPADSRPSDQGGRRSSAAITTTRGWASWCCSIRPGAATRPTARCSGSPATARRSSRSSATG